MKNTYVVFYIDTDGRKHYCISSGSLTFSTDINLATQRDKSSAQSISVYLKTRTNTCKGLEVGYVEIQHTILEPIML